MHALERREQKNFREKLSDRRATHMRAHMGAGGYTRDRVQRSEYSQWYYYCSDRVERANGVCRGQSDPPGAPHEMTFRAEL